MGLSKYRVRCEETTDYPDWEEREAYDPAEAARDHVEWDDECVGIHRSVDSTLEVEVEGHGIYLVKTWASIAYEASKKP